MSGFLFLLHVLHDDELVGGEAEFAKKTHRFLFGVNARPREDDIVQGDARSPTGGGEAIQAVGRLVQSFVQLRRQLAELPALQRGTLFQFSTRRGRTAADKR